MVMIALFFIDTVAFIFMQLYFIYDRRQFSNCVLSSERSPHNFPKA
ncbi:MASE4 domain-containing protein [Bacillus cereus]